MTTNNSAQRSQPGPVAQQSAQIQSSKQQITTPHINEQQPPVKKDNWGFADKTFWEWIILTGTLLAAIGAIAIPFVVTIIGLNFTQKIAQQQAQSSERQHQTDLQIAQDQEREAALQSYLDHMLDLLLNNKLRESKQGDEVRNIAYARTLTVLRRLDPARKGSLLRFLYDAGLLGVSIVFSGNDLRDLTVLDQSIVRLEDADLSNASLSGFTLFGANLSGVNLTKANLSLADLIQVNLSGASLVGTNLDRAILDLSNLSNVDLSNTNLVGANLRKADLTNANLYQTDLSYANLHSATVTDKQLAKAKSLKGATMPNGTIHL